MTTQSPRRTGEGSNPTVNWHREKRSNETHESITDPMARLQEAAARKRNWDIWAMY